MPCGGAFSESYGSLSNAFMELLESIARDLQRTGSRMVPDSTPYKESAACQAVENMDAK